MGKQKKGFNWKARQQGGTLETDVVARWVEMMSLIGLKLVKGALFSQKSLAVIVVHLNL